jgi:arylsulfatase A-like enzyme
MNFKYHFFSTVLTSIFLQQAYSKEAVNFVVIFLDDMGYGDIESTGAIGYKTPNITRLAKEGMRFTDFYAAQAVSSASRAGLLTGCYPNRIGFAGALFPNSNVGLNPNEETIAEILKKKEYATAIFGKWHLGDKQPFLPLQHGFDEYYGIPYSNDMWTLNKRNTNHPPLPLINKNKVERFITTHEDQEEFTTVFTEKSVDFIKRNKDNPFFLYLTHPMPHVPLHVSGRFKGKSELGLYGDVMMEIDWSVGEIMKSLEENGIADNTLIVFTSDNGPWLNYGNHAGSAGGLREGKGCTFDGGMKVPCIMRWPAKIPAGTICNKLSSTIDLLPTFAYISGTTLPQNKIDGVNIYPLLMNHTDATPRETFLYYYRINNLEAVRNSHFKLVVPHTGRSYDGFVPGNDGNAGRNTEKNVVELALYDLRRDPGERYDVKDLYPEVVDELMKVVDNARNDLGDELTNRKGTGIRAIGNFKEVQ